jgi:hypothetical protein
MRDHVGYGDIGGDVGGDIGHGGRVVSRALRQILVV